MVRHDGCPFCDARRTRRTSKNAPPGMRRAGDGSYEFIESSHAGAPPHGGAAPSGIGAAPSSIGVARGGIGSARAGAGAGVNRISFGLARKTCRSTQNPPLDCPKALRSWNLPTFSARNYFLFMVNRTRGPSASRSSCGTRSGSSCAPSLSTAIVPVAVDVAPISVTAEAVLRVRRHRGRRGCFPSQFRGSLLRRVRAG